MIAHRLQTIMTADNLLYLETPTKVRAGQKGTPEYDQIMDQLKSTNYAHQVKDQEEEAQESEESEESEEEKDDKAEVRSAYSKGSNSLQMSRKERRESRAIQKEIRKQSKLTPAALAELKKIEDKKGKI